MGAGGALMAASGAGVTLNAPVLATDIDKPALLGGAPVKTGSFPNWPVIAANDEAGLVGVLKSAKWGRGTGGKVADFETAFAKLMGAPYCLATTSGTTALLTTLKALGIGPGDEVIVPPYTFIASVNVILMCHALPVFVDTDPETFQIDARKVEAAITGRTAAILPVHLGGATFDVDAIQAIARKHNLPIVEDSCQSHLAEWRGQRTGGFGNGGCFSFQASKNLNSGEGGALLTHSEDFVEKCFAFHNNGRGRKQPGVDFSYSNTGLNVRMTEFQAQLLVTQMTRIEEQAKKRTENALYLTRMLREAPGLTPARMYEGCTRNAYHLFMMRYDARQFNGLPRAKFIKALRAEGIPSSGGYDPLNKEPFLKAAFSTRGFQAIYSKERLSRWEAQNQTPENDALCKAAVWLTQNMLLGPRRDMEQIVEAVRKIRRHSSELMKA
jgi:perosamine synthetase